MRLAITFWPDLRHPRGRRCVVSWLGLVERLTATAQRRHNGRGWAPVTFRQDYRELDRVELVYAVGLDFDKGDCSPFAAARLWADHLGFVHTTKRHTPEEPRIRVVLPLSRPVGAMEQRRVWRWCAARSRSGGFHVDPSTKDASRLWFLPSLPAVGLPTVLSLDGAAIDVDRALAEMPPDPLDDPSPPAQPSETATELQLRRARAYLATIPPAVSGQQGHRQTFVAACKLVRGFSLGEADALELLAADYNPRCQPPWSMRALKRKVRQAMVKGRSAPGQLLEARRG